MNYGITLKIGDKPLELKHVAKSIKDMTNTELPLKDINNYLKEILGSRPGKRVILINELAQLIKDNSIRYDETEEIRNSLSGIKIKISQTDIHNICEKEEYNSFRKSIFGKVILSNTGIPMDILYQELSEQYSWIFNPEVTHPSDQLKLLIDFMYSDKYSYIEDNKSIEDIESIIWQYLRSKLNMDIDLKFNIGQRVYVIVKDNNNKRKLVESTVKEIALDSKGWHMHINNTRYSLGTKLVYGDRYEAEQEIEILNGGKRK